MSTTDPVYYYVNAQRQTSGPVSEEELRHLLGQGILSESSSVLRKGETQWKHLSDFLTPAPLTAPAESHATYYYLNANRQTIGPVSEDELRRLLDQRILNASSHVIRKGENQWIRLSQILKIEELPFPPAPVHEAPVAVTRQTLNLKAIEQYLDGINTSMDSWIYRIFGFGKLVSGFPKWTNLSVHLTSVLTVLMCVLGTFAVRTAICAPHPMSNLFMSEAAKKAAEESSKMSGGEFIGYLLISFLAGVLLQYIVGLFSKANIDYFYERKPKLSSTLWPRFNVILLCLLLLGGIYCFFKMSGTIYAVSIVVGMLIVMYLIWLHLNSDQLFLDIPDKKEPSGTSDLIGYITYSLRYMLIALQTLTPVWLLLLNGLFVYILFSEEATNYASALIREFRYKSDALTDILPLLLLPIAIHLGYIIFSLIPELLLAILHGKKTANTAQEQSEQTH